MSGIVDFIILGEYFVVLIYVDFFILKMVEIIVVVYVEVYVVLLIVIIYFIDC